VKLNLNPTRRKRQDIEMESLLNALNQLKSALENTLWSTDSPADSDTSRQPKNSFPPHLRASKNKNVHTVGTQGALLETIFTKEGILDAFHMFQRDTSNFLRAVGSPGAF
jgi:hypothetical protein